MPAGHIRTSPFLLLQGGQQGRSDFQSQMDVLKAEDAANGNGTDIDVLIVPHPKPTRLAE